MDRVELFEAGLALNQVKYNRNLQVLIPLSLGLALTLLRETRSRGSTLFLGVLMPIQPTAGKPWERSYRKTFPVSFK